MPIELDPSSSSPAVGTYIDGDDLINKWGEKQIQLWSQLDQDSTEFDFGRMQQSIDYAEGKLHVELAQGVRYVLPLVGMSAADLQLVTEWLVVLAGVWLASSRFASKGEALPDDLREQELDVLDAIALVRGGVRKITATKHSKAKSAIPRSTA